MIIQGKDMINIEWLVFNFFFWKVIIQLYNILEKTCSNVANVHIVRI